MWHDGAVKGWVTSGSYSHHVGKSVALAYVPAELARANSGFEVEILGEKRNAMIAPAPLFDPKGERMRG